MKSCSDYEMIISALLDEEASREEVLDLFDHLPACAACQRFFRDCRALQDVAAGSRASRSGGRIEALPTSPRPRFPVVLSLAAGIVLALGFALGRAGRPAGESRPGGEGTALTSAPMTEESFVAYARALLESEPRFQTAMREILAKLPAADTEGSHEGELASEETWSTDWTGPPGVQTLDFVSPVVTFSVLPQ